jgi:hypothetical protein
MPLLLLPWGRGAPMETFKKGDRVRLHRELALVFNESTKVRRCGTKVDWTTRVGTVATKNTTGNDNVAVKWDDGRRDVWPRRALERIG